MESARTPFEMDWGPITPDGVNSAAKMVLHIGNFDLSTADRRTNCLAYLLGRLQYYVRQLPAGYRQEVVLDARGQKLDAGVVAAFQASFAARAPQQDGAPICTLKFTLQ